ncbi:hypothetical protein BpHYR1_027576 [Brachionus plicatilis]|uniref:Uncharacterized protein n=1 Tax=Brachionus plicatilis TaxID=10195 RepID=A0A3M7RDU0_BRAPC|nr:hypothetical protein BpHYR1_027576 [Brachionus plicatilis]
MNSNMHIRTDIRIIVLNLSKIQVILFEYTFYFFNMNLKNELIFLSIDSSFYLKKPLKVVCWQCRSTKQTKTDGGYLKIRSS